MKVSQRKTSASDKKAIKKTTHFLSTQRAPYIIECAIGFLIIQRSYYVLNAR